MRNNTNTNQLEAYGIEFVRNNQTYQVYANQEVILTAGVINTPQVLMLSGIGPRQHLTDLGIPVQVDLPVGQGLQDHLFTPVDYLTTDENLIQYGRDINNVLTVQNLYDYYVNNSGPITQVPIVMAFHSSKLNDVPDWPDGIMATLINRIRKFATILKSLNIISKILSLMLLYSRKCDNHYRIFSRSRCMGRIFSTNGW